MQSADTLKKVTEVTTSFNEVGRPYLSEKRESLYDKTGREIMILQYSNSKQLRTKIEFVYDELGRISFRRELMLPDSFFTETFFKYSELNESEPSEILNINSRGKIVFLLRKEFDRDGKILRELWYDSNDTTKIQRDNRFFYNNKGLKTMARYYFEGSLEEEVVFKYNDTGQLIETTETTPDLKIVIKIAYQNGQKIENEYSIGADTFQKLVDTRIYGANGTLLRETLYGRKDKDVRYNYMYDSDKRLTKLLRFENEKLEEVKEYIYEYH